MEKRKQLEKCAISITGEFSDVANKIIKFHNAQIAKRTNRNLIDQEKNAFYIAPSSLKEIYMKKCKNNSSILIPHEPKRKST